ncbi:uncharacterized protein VTP21DRAFT_7385 [Calcarisporiella thermophila]|uniref:uncharacterized protein n=1 Tax=Calcarisporiella thermophila TaxID=911321 RepID=UPI0037441978
MDSDHNLTNPATMRQHITHDDDSHIAEEKYGLQPNRPRFYKTKRFWIIFGVVSAVVLAVFLLLLFLVILPAVRRDPFNSVNFDVSSANVSTKDGSIAIQMSASYNNNGPFTGKMAFKEPVAVSFDGKAFARLNNLPTVDVTSGNGLLLSNTALEVTDNSAFKEFAKKLIISEQVSWHLSSTVELSEEGKEPRTIQFEKELPIAGYNGLDISVSSFQMQGNDSMRWSANVVSRSPISLLLGNVSMDVSYGNIRMGNLNMQDLFVGYGNNTVNIVGNLVPQGTEADLEQLGFFFSDLFAGRRVVTTAIANSLPSSDPNLSPAWVGETLNGLRMNLGFQTPRPLEIISNITVGYLRMEFHPDKPYIPTTSTEYGINAVVTVPFGFSIDISEVKQDIMVYTEEVGALATINTDWGKARNNTEIKRVELSMPASPFKVLPGKEQAFTDFVEKLTLESEANITLAGNATGKAKTPIGTVTLRDLPFAANVTLYGLDGLEHPPPKVRGLDVVGGTKKGLLTKIDTQIKNPSNLEIAMNSDVRTNMEYEGRELSEVVMPDLELNLGNNKVIAETTFDPNASQEGKKLLETYLAGQDNDVVIKGKKHATDVESLNQGLAKINVGTVLPGLGEKLLKSAKLIILPETPKTKVAKTIVQVNNPFTATLQLLKVKSLITNFGIPVGTMNVDKSGDPIVLPGHKVTETTLPLTMNLEMSSIIGILRKNAIRAGLDVRPLDELLKLGGIPIGGQDGNDRRLAKRGIFDGFNIIEFTKKALGHIKVFVEMEIGLRVDEYETQVHYEQTNVDAYTDDSVAILIPMIGMPIIQAILNRSVLGINFAIIQDPANNKFKAKMKGSVTNTGPIDALIHFNEPLNINWNGKNIGAVNMPDLKVVADKGADIDLVADVTVIDAAALEAFSKHLIANPSFDWALESNNLKITSLGATFEGAKLSKKVTLKGMNGLPKGAEIEKFDLPGADKDGIIIESVAKLENPGDIGLTAQEMKFKLFFSEIQIGFLKAINQVLLPGAESHLQLSGRIAPGVPKDILSKLFKLFLSGQKVPMTVVGEEAVGPEGRVNWLSNALQTLKLQVTLNGIPNFKLIDSITMRDMNMVLTQQTAWNPETKSEVTEAVYKVPFKFPVDVKEIEQTVSIVDGGKNITGFYLPRKQVTSILQPDGGLIKFSWGPLPLVVPPDQHAGFSKFLSDITNEASKSFKLVGLADALASTAAGDVELNKVPFDVDTTIAGLAGLKNPPPQQISKVTLGGNFPFPTCGGAGRGLYANVQIRLHNPSQITVTMGELYFKTLWTHSSGKTYIVGPTKVNAIGGGPLTLKPGPNDVQATTNACDVFDPSFHGPIVNEFSLMMIRKGVTLTTVGYTDFNPPSTNIPSLQEAISKISLTLNIVANPTLGLLPEFNSSALPSATTNISSTALSATSLPTANSTAIPTSSEDTPSNTSGSTSETSPTKSPTSSKNEPTSTPKETPPSKEVPKPSITLSSTNVTHLTKETQKLGEQLVGYEQKTSSASLNIWHNITFALLYLCSLGLPLLLLF